MNIKLKNNLLIVFMFIILLTFTNINSITKRHFKKSNKRSLFASQADRNYFYNSSKIYKQLKEIDVYNSVIANQYLLPTKSIVYLNKEDVNLFAFINSSGKIEVLAYNATTDVLIDRYESSITYGNSIEISDASIDFNNIFLPSSDIVYIDNNDFIIFENKECSSDNNCPIYVSIVNYTLESGFNLSNNYNINKGTLISNNQKTFAYIILTLLNYYTKWNYHSSVYDCTKNIVYVLYFCQDM